MRKMQHELNHLPRIFFTALPIFPFFLPSVPHYFSFLPSIPISFPISFLLSPPSLPPPFHNLLFFLISFETRSQFIDQTDYRFTILRVLSWLLGRGTAIGLVRFSKYQLEDLGFETQCSNQEPRHIKLNYVLQFLKCCNNCIKNKKNEIDELKTCD